MSGISGLSIAASRYLRAGQAAVRTTSRIVGILPALLIASLTMVGTAMPAQAQVQRSVVNLGFESPNLGTAPCRVYIAAEQVPGWTTSAPSAATEKSGPV